MPNINFIKRNLTPKRDRLPPKPAVQQWTIAVKQNDKNYYMVGFDDNGALLWSSKKDKALTFSSQRVADKFRYKYLAGRSDVFFVVGTKG